MQQEEVGQTYTKQRSAVVQCAVGKTKADKADKVQAKPKVPKIQASHK